MLAPARYEQPQTCFRDRTRISPSTSRVPPCGETEHASAQVLADSLLIVGRKGNSATLEPGFRSVADRAISDQLLLPAL